MNKGYGGVLLLKGTHKFELQNPGLHK